MSLNEKKICLIIFEINVRKLSTRSKTEALSIMLPTLFFVKGISNLVSLTVIDSVIFKVAGIIFKIRLNRLPKKLNVKK